MALRDLSGLGAMQDALGQTNTNLSKVLSELQETNRLLAGVLGELQETNGQRLERMSEELHGLNTKIDSLVTRLSTP